MLSVVATLMWLVVKAVLFPPCVGLRTGVWWGDVLTPDTHPVTAVVRGIGLSQEQQFQQYPHMLTRVRGRV